MTWDFYLTSTFRHEWNRAFNGQIGAALEARGLKAYLPHRDTDQTATPQVRFDSDLAGMQGSRVILAIAENESPNWGAEVGYAYGMGIPIIALKREGHDIPLIAGGMMEFVLAVSDLDDMEDYIERLVALIRRSAPLQT